MTKTSETPARIITENESRSITQKLDYWNDGIRDFQDETNETLRALKEKLENPTRANLHSIRADLAALLEAQRMIQDINASCRAGLHDLTERFSKTFTILDL